METGETNHWKNLFAWAEAKVRTLQERQSAGDTLDWAESEELEGLIKTLRGIRAQKPKHEKKPQPAKVQAAPNKGKHYGKGKPGRSDQKSAQQAAPKEPRVLYIRTDNGFRYKTTFLSDPGTNRMKSYLQAIPWAFGGTKTIDVYLPDGRVAHSFFIEEILEEHEKKVLAPPWQ